MKLFFQIINGNFLAVIIPACLLYFLFLLFIHFKFEVDYADELLVLYVVPVIYAANQFSKRIYLIAILYIAILSHFFIYLTTSDFFEGSLIVFVILILYLITSELLFQSSRNVKEIANHLKITLQSIGDAVITTDTNGQIIYMNAAAEELLDKPLESLLGKDVNESMLLKDSQSLEPITLPANQVNDQEVKFYCHSAVLMLNSGKNKFVSGSASVSMDDGGNDQGIVFVFHEITQDIKYQQEIKKREQMYRQAIEVADAVPYYQNYETNQYEFVGEGILQLTGYTPNEFTPDLWQTIEEELVLFKDLKNLNISDAVKKAKSNEGISWRADYKITTKNGGLKWLSNAAIQVRDEYGNVIGSLGILQDITDRKQIEVALEKNRQMYRQAIEASGAVPYYLNYQTENYDFLGNNINVLTGYTPEEFTPEIWNKIIIERLQQNPELKNLSVQDSIKKSKTESGTDWKCDYKIKTRTGVERWVSNTAIQVLDDSGNVIGSLGTLQDITDRKIAEEALKVSETRFRKYFELGLVGMAITSPEKGWVEINDKLCDMFGYSRNELNNLTWSELTHPDDLELDVNYFNRVLAGEIEGYSIEKRYLHKNGKTIHTELSVRAIRKSDNTVDYFLALIHDNSDRKNAEEALKISELRFRRYFELGLVGMAITTPEKGWIEYNDTLCDMFGYTRNEFKNKNWEEMTHPNDVEYNLNYFKKALAGEIDDYIIEKRFIHKNGSSVYAIVSVKAQRNQDGSVENFLVLVHNITENKLAAEELRQSETKLKNIIDSTQAVFWQLDLQSQRFTYMSEQIEELLGYPANSWSDMQDWVNRIHPEDRKNSVDYCISQTNEGVNHEFEYRMISKDQKEVWIRDTVTIIKEDQKPIALIGFFFDITKQKLVETELQNIDKLNSIGTLAGGIAHDFNNVLTGVFGNLSIAKDELVSTHPSHEYIQDAIQSLNRAKRLTKQLLTFSKGGDPVKEPVNLKELVEEIVRFDLSGSNVKPVFYMADEICIAEIDKGQLQQVVSNLTINANQAMTEGGLLHISIKRYSNHSRQLSYLKDLDYIQITFQDNGTGIDPNVIDRIFEPFFSTKHTGYGLGLATVFSIVNKHDGYVHVESELGKGSVFTIYIPALTEFVEHITQDIQENPDWEKQSANILVMDDEEVIRNLLSSSLSRFGFNVQVKSNGREAVDTYQSAFSNGHPFDIVILDITVPGGMGGEEAIQEILKINPEAKCIVSSGYANDPVLANYKDYGFKAVAPKPYTLTEMKDIINQVLNG